jgi:phosphoribosylformylglycinamidine (FGAM) synthase PurS component
MRIIIKNKNEFKDSFGDSVKKSIIEDLEIKVKSVKTADVYEIKGIITPEEIAEILVDPVLQDFSAENLGKTGKEAIEIEIGFLDGVTDNVGETVRQSVKKIFNKDVFVKTSKLYFIEGVDKDNVKKICDNILFNKLIQYCRIGE